MTFLMKFENYIVTIDCICNLLANLLKTGPTELLKILREVISKFSGRDIIISPGLKYFSVINPRPVSINNMQNELKSQLANIHSQLYMTDNTADNLLQNCHSTAQKYISIKVMKNVD